MGIISRLKSSGFKGTIEHARKRAKGIAVKRFKEFVFKRGFVANTVVSTDALEAFLSRFREKYEPVELVRLEWSE